MFLILKTTDWKEENYIKSNIIPFGWSEDDNRQISNNEKIVAKVQTEAQRDFLLEKLNNKYVKHLRVPMFEKGTEQFLNGGGKMKEAELKEKITDCSNCKHWYYSSTLVYACDCSDKTGDSIDPMAYEHCDKWELEE